MTTQINVQAVVALGFKKLGKNVDVPFGSYSPEVLEQILYRGAHRILGDGIGGKDVSAADAEALIQKRMDTWANGEFASKTRESNADPVAAQAMRMAIAAIKGDADYRAFVTAHGGKPSEKVNVDELSKRAKVLAARDDVLASAKAALELISAIKVAI